MDREKKRLLEPMMAAVLYHDRLPGGGEVWRAIAAFDTDVVAERYAKKAGLEHGELERYRVVKFFT